MCYDIVKAALDNKFKQASKAAPKQRTVLDDFKRKQSSSALSSQFLEYVPTYTQFKLIFLSKWRIAYFCIA